MNTAVRFVLLPAALAAALASVQALSAMPAALEPADAMLAIVVPAKGHQIYECRAKGDTQEWTFVAPDAELFDMQGRTMGTHFAGPTWRATDGSRIVAKVAARVDAPVAGAIPWLLLAASNDGPTGRFSAVTYIQRVNTVGGVAPTAGCTRESLGQEARMAYTAEYRMFVARPGATTEAR